jgi:predicted transcriptional regulator
METAETIKEQAHRLLDTLPEDANWDDVVYRMVVRREIERGLADSDAGRVTPIEEVMHEFGIRDE